MGEPWFERLRTLCAEAAGAADFPYSTDVVLFYMARWCQKETGTNEPRISSLDPATLERAAAGIARNLREDGETIESLLSGDRAAWGALGRMLLASAWSRVRDASAEEFAHEARQKIALVLLTGTPPSRAAEELRAGPEGPRNEYVFQSPFSFWARAVVIHLIIDERRREAQRPEPPRPPRPKKSPDSMTHRAALDALPELVAAIRTLPRVQKSVFVLSLSRADVDEVVRERLHELDPELFSPSLHPPASDGEIAERLGTTPKLVAANRSAARRKLAREDPHWELLLDGLLPHRSTRRHRAIDDGTRVS